MLLKYWPQYDEDGLLLDILLTTGQATEGDPSKLSQIYLEFFMHIIIYNSIRFSLLSSNKLLYCQI